MDPKWICPPGWKIYRFEFRVGSRRRHRVQTCAVKEQNEAAAMALAKRWHHYAWGFRCLTKDPQQQGERHDAD